MKIECGLLLHTKVIIMKFRAPASDGQFLIRRSSSCVDGDWLVIT